jgi:hypothetical protein
MPVPAAPAATDELCAHCQARPRFPPHNFCGKTCAAKAGAATLQSRKSHRIIHVAASAKKKTGCAKAIVRSYQACVERYCLPKGVTKAMNQGHGKKVTCVRFGWVVDVTVAADEAGMDEEGDAGSELRHTSTRDVLDKVAGGTAYVPTTDSPATVWAGEKLGKLESRLGLSQTGSGMLRIRKENAMSYSLRNSKTDGRAIIVSGSEDGKVKVWIENGECIQEFGQAKPVYTATRCVRKAGCCFCAEKYGKVAPAPAKVGHSQEITCLELFEMSPGRWMVVTASYDCTWRLWTLGGRCERCPPQVRAFPPPLPPTVPPPTVPPSLGHSRGGCDRGCDQVHRLGIKSLDVIGPPRSSHSPGTDSSAGEWFLVTAGESSATGHARLAPRKRLHTWCVWHDQTDLLTVC